MIFGTCESKADFEGACTIACIVGSFFDAHTFDAHTKDAKTQCYTDIGVCFVDTDIGV